MSGRSLPTINTQDARGQDVVSESSDDHFSSASEGSPNPAHLSVDIPITRVERVDDKAAHGEVPGTPAYDLRTRDAVPDEIEIVPDGQRSRSATTSRSRSSSHLSARSLPQTPSETPVPKTVVERVDNQPAHGEVDGTLAKEKRMADAVPDEVRRAPARAVDGSGTSHDQSTPTRPRIEQDPEDRQAWFRSMWEGKSQDDVNAQPTVAVVADDNDPDDEEEDEFGDDFDEFVEEGGDDDFGDFDEPETPAAHSHSTLPTSNTLAGLPPLDLTPELCGSDLQETIAPYLDAIFPDSSPLPTSVPPLDPANSSPFLSERSLSLWQQLVSPPPMQPPNWTRSRIRRLFLVSLGVPVNLDEILPPSKQKRLVLPDINLAPSSSALERVRSSGANSSTTSVDSRTGARRPGPPRRTHTAGRGPPPAPDFDANAAALVCTTTDTALHNFPPNLLRDHVFTLEILTRQASAVLEHWLQRKDDARKEKEALEGVIENLVGFVKGRRGR